MPNYTARQMLAQLPLRRAQGGPVYMAEGGAAADQAVLSFISANPNASLEAIATQITNTGADLNNVAAALNIPADVAQDAFAKANANNQALLAAEARIMGEMDTAGAEWNAAQAYNEILKSGVTTQQALDAGVKRESIDRIFSTDQPIPTAGIAATSGRPSAFDTSPAFAGQNLADIAASSQAYVAGLMEDGVITPEERRQTQDFAIAQGVTLQDMAAAGVDPNLLFDTSAADARRAEEARLAAEKAAAEKAAAEKAAAEKAAADKAAADKAAAESAAAAKAAAEKAAADKANADAAAAAKAAAEKAAADKAAADKAAADKAAADKAIADAAAAKAAADKAAADKAAADKAAADKAAADKTLSDEERAAAAAAAADSARIAAEAKAAADKKAFDERIASEVARILGEAEAARLKALADKMGAAASGVDVNKVADTVGAVTTDDIVSAVSGNDLTNLGLDNTPSTTVIEGTTTTPIDTTAAKAVDTGINEFLETYVAPTATVFPTYTADTVYQPLPTPAPIYAEGETALDTDFRASAPRTASYNPQTGAFQGYDYTTAAKLLPATGSGMSFTPPSVTSRPRQLLSAAASQPGLSASQRFARARQAQQANLMQAFSDTGAKKNSANYYDWMNQIRSGMFNNAAGQFDNQLFLNAFNPWAATQLNSGPVTTTTGDALAAADPYTVNAVNLDDFTGFDDFNVYSGLGNSNQTFNTEVDAEGRPSFAGGGYVKKSRGFADGGPADSMTAEELTAQLMAMDSAAAAQAPRPTDQAQTESRSMLDNLNRAMSQVTQPVVAAVTDMTVGLGDLAQMGTKAVANKMGIETKPFVPVGENIKASVGADNVSPLNPIYMGTQILPAAKLQKALAAGPAAYRELMAYLAGEGGAKIAETQFPDSLAAQLAGAVSGDMSARGILDSLDGRNVRRITGDEPPIDDEFPLDDGPLLEGEPEGTVLEISDQSESSKMLDDVDAIPLPLENLDKTEKAALNKSAGRNPKKRELARSVGEAFKTNYNPDQGWAPVTILGAEFKGNTAKVKTKKIPYGFQNPPEGMEPQQWQQQLSDGIVNEVETVVQRAEAGDKAALDILAQANWYRGMRDQLRSEFGGIGDVFADILGTTSAQTNVEQNFNNAVEILRKYSRGDYDAELAAYQKRVDAGEPVDGKTLTRMHKEGEFPLITKDSGALFNTNSPSSMGALLDMFRTVKSGAAPKTPNFTGNLIGLTNEATVDVWAARMLRRLSGQDRIPPAAEQGVTGTHRVGSTLFEPKVGGEFGFGQEVFRDAANRVNQSGSVQRVNPDLGALGPDDLQAIAWFMEKERWAKNGWTTKSGEGGSLEYEMSLAGSQSPERVAELRREVNAGFKQPKQRKNETDSAYDLRVMDARTAFEETRRAAQDELASLAAPLSRVQLGVAGERPNQPMSGYAQAELAAEFDDVVRDDPSVLTYNLANTYGSFMGDTERALNAEFIVRDNFDMQPLRTRLIEQGKAYDQDAVFLSRVVPEGTPNARPGVEIYFRETITPEQMAKVTERLREKGVDGFTYVTDMRFNDRINRQTRSGDPETAGLTGLRFQYVPEFDDAFDPQNATESYNKAEDLFFDVVKDTVADGNVSDARVTYYDTEVYFRDDYDEQLTRFANETNSPTRGELSGSSNASQPNSGAKVGTKLSGDVPDGVVQEARTEKVAPVKKARGGSVERVYNDNRTYK
jgi:hypothetical protein